MKLCLVQGADEAASDKLSVFDEASEVHIGADMKWFPRGVGKWSLRGESHSALFGDLSWGDLFRPLSTAYLEAKAEPRIGSSSTSIMVLSDGRLLSACPEDDGGRYVVDGN